MVVAGVKGKRTQYDVKILVHEHISIGRLLSETFDTIGRNERRYRFAQCRIVALTTLESVAQFL